MRWHLRPNAFGALFWGMFVVLWFTINVHRQRFRLGAQASLRAILLPALRDTATASGFCVALMVVVLRLTRAQRVS